MLRDFSMPKPDLATGEGRTIDTLNFECKKQCPQGWECDSLCEDGHWKCFCIACPFVGSNVCANFCPEDAGVPEDLARPPDLSASPDAAQPPDAARPNDMPLDSKSKG